MINGIGDSLSLFLQQKDGTFSKPRQMGAEGGPVSAGAADFNGDGILDLVVANSRSDNVSYMIGKGDGSFQHPPLNIHTGRAPFSVLARDLNGDGNPDLAVINNEDQTLTVLYGKWHKKDRTP